MDHIINSCLSFLADWDITVTCGTDSIHLSILLCPVYYAGFNESLIALNGKFNTPACYGIADLKASTPVLKFNFSVSADEMSFCDSSLEVQTVNTILSPYNSHLNLEAFKSCLSFSFQMRWTQTNSLTTESSLSTFPEASFLRNQSGTPSHTTKSLFISSPAATCCSIQSTTLK